MRITLVLLTGFVSPDRMVIPAWSFNVAVLGADKVEDPAFSHVPSV